jgi:hypothetical protein
MACPEEVTALQKRAFSTVASRDAYRFDDDRRRVPRRDDIARLGVRDMGHQGAWQLPGWSKRAGCGKS